MSRTPRRSVGAGLDSSNSDSPHTPSAAPPGLVISKLGIRARAEGSVARGVLCLKVTLPRDGDGRPNRWGLFSGAAPKLLSIPAVYPLPASLALLRTPSNLTTAAALLNLPPPGSYPPAPAESASALRPYIDVSATTGQVYVVVDGSPPQARRASIGSRKEGGGGRSEWLVVVEFEVPIETVLGDTDELFKVTLHVPKCLDNVVRFQIIPRDDNSANEASIATEPKVLLLPRSAFGRDLPWSPSRRKPRIEEDWEDGEVPGADSDEYEEDEDVGSWLEGRFQSTDTLSLEWGFVPSLGSPSDLCITPRWNESCPTITMMFEANLPTLPGPLTMEAITPEGWGWSELQIRGDGLLAWRSTDAGLASASVANPDDTIDSAATADAFSTRAALSRQLDLAALDPGDFSFELSSFEKPAQPPTPSLRRSLTSELASAAIHRVTPRHPVPAAVFELEFEQADEDDEEDRVILLKGVLVPLPLTLVSPDMPMTIPFVRFDDPTLPAQCVVTCPEATYTASSEAATDAKSPGTAAPRLCSALESTMGTFAWTDSKGKLVPTRATQPVVGAVRTVVQRSVWGVQTVSTAFVWPARAAEISLCLSEPSVRVVRATSRHAQLARTVREIPNGAEVRLSGGHGGVELVLEVADDDAVAIPSFIGATGELQVELAGDGWHKLLADKLETNLTQTSERAFRGDLSVPPLLTFKPLPPAPKAEPPKAARRFVSWTTLASLALVWILVSLAQEVQRLRAEVAFVAEEARDIRLYGLERPVRRERQHEPYADGRWDGSAVEVPAPEPEGSEPVEVESHAQRDSSAPPAAPAGKPLETSAEPVPAAVSTPAPRNPPVVSHRAEEYGLGRVVFPHSSWGSWVHPPLAKIHKSVSWLWHMLWRMW